MNRSSTLADGQALFEADTVCQQLLGAQLLACSPGTAVLRMEVQARHLNNHRTCHGGLMFTLADAAFSIACNSHGHPAVAAGGSVDFLRPAQLGDVLTCECTEQLLQGRHGVYDAKVSNQHGDVVASFRGRSMRLREAEPAR